MSKIKFQIKNRFTGSIIFEYESENNTIKETVQKYIKQELETKYRANLTDADLTDADLTRANLTDADLTRADLTDADLNIFKNDIWVILLRSNETAYLLKALKEGEVNGSCYEGKCACLVGTIAKSKQCKYNDSEKMNGLIPDSSRPAERWFLQIKPGQTPENSNAVKKTVEWVEEFEMLIAMKK